MDPANAILIKTFGNIADADLAAGHLRSHGIECVIRTDDCAGMYPSMGIIQLLVDPGMADDARKILRDVPRPMERLSETPIQSAESSRESSPPPRVYRFNSGMLVGLMVGALLYFSYTKYEQYRNQTVEYDYDNDGVLDEEVVWRHGQFVESRLDRNADGRVDYWTYYRDGAASHEEGDDNFDGRVDLWSVCTSRLTRSQVALDTDFNGVRDVTMFYTNGVIAQSDWKPNGTNVLLVRQWFRHGVLREEFRDENGDGRFDVSIHFDAFTTPISTNRLPTPLPPGRAL